MYAVSMLKRAASMNTSIGDRKASYTAAKFQKLRTFSRRGADKPKGPRLYIVKKMHWFSAPLTPTHTRYAWSMHCA